MATLKKTPGAQWPLTATFEFNIANTDSMARVSDGTVQAFGGASAAYDVFNLPYNAVVVGGELIVTTVSNDGGTATLSVGDSASATRYLGATNIKATGRTVLVPTGYIGLGEALRITIANGNGDATTGRVRVNVSFIIDGRQTENLRTT